MCFIKSSRNGKRNKRVDRIVCLGNYNQMPN
jgi:hypothetical protein